jgi:hypothetical protein
LAAPFAAIVGSMPAERRAVNMLRSVRESAFKSMAVAIGGYALAVGVGLYLHRVSGGSLEARLAGALLVSAALLVTALVTKGSGYPRWSLLVASGVFAAGMIVAALPWPGAHRGSDGWLSTGGYAWMLVVLLGGTPQKGPRWCHSPWVVVGVSVLLTLGTLVVGGSY